MKRYMDAMLKDVEKGVAEDDTVPSEDSRSEYCRAVGI